MLQRLLAQAPDPLATVIALKFEGEPRQVLGAGHLLIDEDPWRRAGEPARQKDGRTDEAQSLP